MHLKTFLWNFSVFVIIPTAMQDLNQPLTTSNLEESNWLRHLYLSGFESRLRPPVKFKSLLKSTKNTGLVETEVGRDNNAQFNFLFVLLINVCASKKHYFCYICNKKMKDLHEEIVFRIV